MEDFFLVLTKSKNIRLSLEDGGKDDVIVDLKENYFYPRLGQSGKKGCCCKQKETEGKSSE